MALKEKREKGNDAVCWYPWSIYVQGQKIMMIKIQLPYLGRESAQIEDVKNAGHQGSAPYIVIWKSCRKFQFYKIAHQHLSFEGSFAVVSLMIRIEKYVQTTE
jgi:hypothetical protein